MDSNAIQVAIRVRPFHPEKEEPFVIRPLDHPFFLGDGGFTSSPRKPVTSGSIRQVINVNDDRMLDFDKPEPGSETRRGQPGAKRYKDRRYIFDHILGMAASQEDVFRKTTLPLLEGILTGFNATIFAYGATGCGKTHTISGTHEDPGVVIRTTAELFRLIEESSDEFDTHIELSMVEIYNETIRDLLSDDFPACPSGGLRLLENERNRVTVAGVTLKRPKSVDDVMDLVLVGNSRRSTSYTAMNSQSSRSHAVLQINVGRSSKGHDINVGESIVRQCLTSATLSIIDLAGSERASATQNMGARMKEGGNINKSLLSLSNCIAALCQRPIRGVKPHVPYRNSKLTRMLKFSLGGNCRTVMIVCVSPSSKDLEDTFNTLTWADKAKNVTTKVSRNTAGVDVRTGQYIEALARKEQEIKDLKATILRMEANETVRQDKRRLLEKTDIERTITEFMAQVRNGMSAMETGAAYRAQWDEAEMLVAALKSRMDGLTDKDEISFINSLVSQQCTRYQNNADMSNAVRKEQTTRSTIDGVLSNARTRKFGDAADKADVQTMLLNVQLQQCEMDKRMLEAREKAYREATQGYATALANVAVVLKRVQGVLEKQREVVAGRPGMSETSLALEQLGLESKDALAELFVSATGKALPPAPTAGSLPAMSSASPYKMRSPMPPSTNDAFSAPIGSTSALFNAPQTQPYSIGAAAIAASPAGKRLLASRAMVGHSPAPKRRYGSPKVKAKLASSSPAVASAAPVKAARGIRFNEDVEVKYMTSESSFQSGSGGEADAESDWHDEDEDVGDKDKMVELGNVKKVGGSDKREKAEPMRTVTIGPVGPSATAPRMMALPGKARRLSTLPTASRISPKGSGFLNHGVSSFKSTLVSLDEREGTSSPEPTKHLPVSAFSGLGPAARAPLNERRTVPGANTSLTSGAPDESISGLPSSSLSSGFSNAARPTQASMGKNSGMGLGMPSKGRPSVALGGMPSHSDRRVSSAGPVRNERARNRASMAPGMSMATGISRLGDSSFSFAPPIAGSGSAFGSMSTIPGTPLRDSGSSESAPSGSDSSEGDGNGSGNGDGKGNRSAEMGPPALPLPAKVNPLAGGASRLSKPTASTLNRRMSTVGINGSAGSGGNGSGIVGAPNRGPRASVSMAQLRNGPRGSVVPASGGSRLR